MTAPSRPPHPFDLITRETLTRPTSRKWSLHPETIGAWVAEMDFGTAPEVAKALHRAVDDGVFGYLSPALAAEAARATADHYAHAHGWHPEPGGVHSVTDVLTAFSIAVTGFSRPGSAVIVPTPAHMPFLTHPEALGRQVVQVPGVLRAGRWSIDLDGVDAAFAAGAGTLLLCNPHNPTGRVHTRDELAAVAEVVERHHGRVFADEIHAPLRYDGAAHIPYASVSEAAARHSVTATSATKGWNVPGLKAAQLILTNDADQARYRRGRLGRGHEAATLGVIATIAAYRDGGAWLADVVDYLDGNRRLLAEAVPALHPSIGYTSPESTYFAWLDLGALALPGSAQRFLQERAGVTLTDGALCGDGFGEHVRLVFATPRPILEAALDAIGHALEQARAAPGSPSQAT